MSSLLYFIREAFKGLARHMSTTVGSIITIFLSLLIIGVSAIAGTIVQNIMNSIEDEVSITAYVSDDADEATIQAMEEWIGGLEGVSNVTFTNKDQALEDFKASMSSEEISKSTSALDFMCSGLAVFGSVIMPRWRS